MPSAADRLANCFALVFPGVPVVELARASIHSLPEWDSIANINLSCVIEEEFGMEMVASELEDLISFSLVLAYVEKKCVEKSAQATT